MATLTVVTHEYDVFAYRNPEGRLGSPYLLFDVLQQLQAMGHRCQVVKGAKAVSADAALLHVDATIVGEDYLALAANYARTVNFGAADISKRRISRLLLAKGDAWDGPVIVKADLNNQGTMEDIHNRMALKAGRPPPHPGVRKTGAYRVVERLADVEDAVWDDPALVVERFIPEPDPDGGFVIRTWVFMGAKERCTRFVTPTHLSKAGDVLRYAAMEVPAQLRAERERLGFDFGKFDFVMRGGEPVLLDANRTPGVAAAILPLMKAGAPALAQGLAELIGN
jgi:hypothetical protein